MNQSPLPAMQVPKEYSTVFNFLTGCRLHFFRTCLRLSSKQQKILRVIVIDSEGILFVYSTEGERKREVNLLFDVVSVYADHQAVLIQIEGQHDLALEFHVSRSNSPEATHRRFLQVLNHFLPEKVRIQRVSKAFNMIDCLEDKEKAESTLRRTGSFVKEVFRFKTSSSNKISNPQSAADDQRSPSSGSLPSPASGPPHLQLPSTSGDGNLTSPPSSSFVFGTHNNSGSYDASSPGMKGRTRSVGGESAAGSSERVGVSPIQLAEDSARSFSRRRSQHQHIIQQSNQRASVDDEGDTPEGDPLLHNSLDSFQAEENRRGGRSRSNSLSPRHNPAGSQQRNRSNSFRSGSFRDGGSFRTQEGHPFGKVSAAASSLQQQQQLEKKLSGTVLQESDEWQQQRQRSSKSNSSKSNSTAPTQRFVPSNFEEGQQQQGQVPAFSSDDEDDEEARQLQEDVFGKMFEHIDHGQALRAILLELKNERLNAAVERTVHRLEEQQLTLRKAADEKRRKLEQLASVQAAREATAQAAASQRAQCARQKRQLAGLILYVCKRQQLLKGVEDRDREAALAVIGSYQLHKDLYSPGSFVGTVANANAAAAAAASGVSGANQTGMGQFEEVDIEELEARKREQRETLTGENRYTFQSAANNNTTAPMTSSSFSVDPSTSGKKNAASSPSMVVLSNSKVTPSWTLDQTTNRDPMSRTINSSSLSLGSSGRGLPATAAALLSTCSPLARVAVGNKSISHCADLYHYQALSSLSSTGPSAPPSSSQLFMTHQQQQLHQQQLGSSLVGRQSTPDTFAQLRKGIIQTTKSNSNSTKVSGIGEENNKSHMVGKVEVVGLVDRTSDGTALSRSYNASILGLL